MPWTHIATGRATYTLSVRNLPNLDLLRAIAVLTVVVEHTMLASGLTLIGSWQVAWIGVVGVFLFFVHTSLVLMWSLERKPHTLDFYIRRAYRIYPLAIFAGVAALVSRAKVGGTPLDSLVAHGRFVQVCVVARGLLLLPNVGRGPQFLSSGVMWTLPYEVEMYVALPLLFFFVRQNFSIWPLLLFWVLVVLLNVPLFGQSPHNIYQCIPYFLPGVMAYVGFSLRRARIPAWLFVPFLVAVWAWFMHAPGWRKASFLCLVVGLALPLFHQIRTKWLITSSHKLAQYSYGIYLSHPFAIAFGIHTLHAEPLWVRLLAVVAGTAGLSVAAYHLLEYPMIRVGSRVAARAERRWEQRSLAQFRLPQAEIS